MTLELFYYAEKSERAMPVATIEDVYQSFNISGLYNGKIFQDVWLNYMDENWSNLWTTENFKEYLRFITIEMGLTGMYTKKSPREMIEGYNDPLIETLYTMPVYMGGDQTTSPFLSLDVAPTHPANNRIAFFTGVDDYKLTRTYGQWLEEDEILILGKDYKSLNELVDIKFRPWSDKILLDGTDGM